MVRLVVSEPWDFVGPNGRNELVGVIVKKLDKNTLLFKCSNDVAIAGTTGRYWVLTARYKDQTFEADSYCGTVNGSLLRSEPIGSESSLELRQLAVFAIVGGLQEVE